jgi:hypothetical protein
MYDVPIARNENASTIGCKQEVIFKISFRFLENCMENLKKYFFCASNLKKKILTPTAPLLDLSSSNGSETLLFPAMPGSVPRITPSHTRNRARGMAVPATIAVLQNPKRIYLYFQILPKSSIDIVQSI